ncbi:hypothetical protein ACFWDI_28390 [Streptomyces sp. NPDC060064]|uniref:phage tail tube protein n=1 Tax=Streptomyces sp. NPDC060064 TaxID=3347049 RepID=UPI0036C46ABC
MIQISVDPDNLIQGPAAMYRGAFGATEPADSTAALNASPPASAWSDIGGTTDGVKLSIENTYGELEVDQIVDRVGSRLTKRMTSVETNMAEVTLDNLAYALNGGTTASGSGYKTYEPNDDSSATQPSYSAVLFDGIAPDSLRRRVIVRKVLSTDSVELAYTKDKQTVLKVKMQAHYVSPSIRTYKIIDGV